MKLNGILKDQSFWSLLTINVAILVYYQQNHTGFSTLLYIYWAQSVLIGFFTFLQLATIRRVKPGTLPINDGDPTTSDAQARGCMATFFAVHYGGFHLGYFFFIFLIIDIKEPFDWALFKFSVVAFAIDQLLNFIKMKQWEKTHQPNGSVVFFLPYARIIPMHLVILVPKFFSVIPPLTFFLILKMFADILMQVVTMKVYNQPEMADKAVISANISE